MSDQIPRQRPRLLLVEDDPTIIAQARAAVHIAPDSTPDSSPGSAPGSAPGPTPGSAPTPDGSEPGVPASTPAERAPRLDAASLSSGIEALAIRLWSPRELALATSSRTADPAVSSGAAAIAAATAAVGLRVVESLDTLRGVNLREWDVVLAAISLPGSRPLDLVRYVHSVRPTMPVIMMGRPEDADAGLRAIREGALDFILTTGSGLQLLPLTIEKCIAHQRTREQNDRLRRELTESFAELAVKNQQLQSVVHQLEEAARTDDLTGLCNRRWLNLMLQRTWAEATRNDLPLGFIMIDLDGFKALNDRMGHQCGDDLLRLASKVIEANCRQVDIVARYGGDEFCVLMPHTEAHEASRVAERILREFRLAVRRMSASSIDIGMSIGVAHLDLSRPLNADQLIVHADEAMYAAKTRGKGRAMLRQTTGSVPVADDLRLAQ